MWYIVWREPFKSYGREQGGYYVSYKDKCSDNYSNNWFEAKRYKSLGSAIDRLGIDLDYIERKTLDEFMKINMSDSSLRDMKLAEVLNENYEITFSKGRIDKVNEKGEFVGIAYDEVVEWVKILMNKKKAELKKKLDKLYKIDPDILNISKNIIQHVDGEDFWDGF